MGSRGLAFVAALAAAFTLLPATGGEARKKTCKVRGSHSDGPFELTARAWAVAGIVR